MSPIAVAVVGAFVVFVWILQLRKRRRRWVRRLNLRGRWQVFAVGASDADQSSPTPVANLELGGTAEQGDYRWVSGAGGRANESGRWVLAGRHLHLHPTPAGSAVRDIQLTLLQPGELGLAEPADNEYWLLRRSQANVVAMPLREQQR